MRIHLLSFVLVLCAVGLACGRGRLDGKLIDAAVDGDTASVERLLDQGAGINAHAHDDWTPLTVAAREGKIEVVRLLLKRGANVNAKEGGGHTALFWARKYQHLEVERVLLAAGGKDE